MIKKLIALADVLDIKDHKEAADAVDNLIRTAKDDDVVRDWERETPTQVDGEIMPTSVPPPSAASFEDQDVMSGLEIVRDLRDIFRGMPNPDKWDDETKKRVMHLNRRLMEIL